MKAAFNCADEDLAASGLACADDDPCPVYLELSSVSASGRRLAVAGNLHGSSVTLYSILLLSDDGGTTWKEPAARIPGAALEQVQLLDSTHAWAAGELQVPLPRDPFVLSTRDGGNSWHQTELTEEGGTGAVLRFSFDTPDHGELILDSGRASSARYSTWESRTAGDSWNATGKTAQVPATRRGAPAMNNEYRLGTDSASRSYVIERRNGTGDSWSRIASFLVQVAGCGTRHLPPPVDASTEPAVGVK